MKKISSILIPFDFSVSANSALDYALTFVGESEIKIKLLHIPDEIEREYDKVTKVCDEQLQNPIKWIFAKGNLTNIIITTAEKESAEIIMIGANGLSDKENSININELVSTPSPWLGWVIAIQGRCC